MDIDKVYNLFFSPTDTTKFVLQFLSEQISPNYKNINLTSRNTNLDDVSEKDLIKLDFSGLTPFKGNGKTGGIHFDAKTKKIAGFALGIAALAGLGVAGYKSGWLSPRFEEDPKPHGHLSCVG